MSRMNIHGTPDEGRIMVLRDIGGTTTVHSNGLAAEELRVAFERRRQRRIHRDARSGTKGPPRRVHRDGRRTVGKR